MNWYFEVLKNYVGFSGRARRKEYWMFTLIHLIIYAVLFIMDLSLGLTFGDEGNGILSSLYMLAVFLPSLAVTVRRLHDTDRSGWWILIGIVPIIGFVVLLIFMVREGHSETNEHGPDPKQVY